MAIQQYKMLDAFIVSQENAKLKAKRRRHAEYMREWRKTHPEYRQRQKETFQRFREKNPNYFNDYNKKWRRNNPEKVLQRLRKYRKKHPEKRAEQRARYAERHPDRKSARRRALRIDVDRCSICGSTEHIERHHPDYSKPLVIVPLCHDCHVNEHQSAPSMSEIIELPQEGLNG